VTPTIIYNYFLKNFFLRLRITLKKEGGSIRDNYLLKLRATLREPIGSP
jgi:hypothetical protein